MKRHVSLQQAAVNGRKLHIMCKDRRTVIGIAERYENGYIKLRHTDGFTYIAVSQIDQVFKLK